MRRDQFEHLIRAAGGVLNENEIIVIGSQAILGSFSEGLPADATISRELDVLPLDDAAGTKADLIDGTLGEGSIFSESFGVFADGVSLTTSRLSEGWRSRLIGFRTEDTNGVTALCLEPHDLLIAKYLANREKDRQYCTAVVRAGFVRRETLEERLAKTECTADERRRTMSAIRSDFGLSAEADPLGEPPPPKKSKGHDGPEL